MPTPQLIYLSEISYSVPQNVGLTLKWNPTYNLVHFLPKTSLHNFGWSKISWNIAQFIVVSFTMNAPPVPHTTDEEFSRYFSTNFHMTLS